MHPAFYDIALVSIKGIGLKGIDYLTKIYTNSEDIFQHASENDKIPSTILEQIKKKVLLQKQKSFVSTVKNKAYKYFLYTTHHTPSIYST